MFFVSHVAVSEEQRKLSRGKAEPKGNLLAIISVTKINAAEGAMGKKMTSR